MPDDINKIEATYVDHIVWYDGPQLFTVESEGKTYLCVALENNEEFPNWRSVAFEFDESDKEKLKNKTHDLRYFMKKNDIHYEFDLCPFGDPLMLTLYERRFPLPDEDLAEENFFIDFD